ncbi:hypothetical protein MSA_10250 [Streptococcus agalactiae ILRI005]|nr:hypothetical protein MSA_10250 [Streptococcus agalactiae ILRI005]
MRKFQKQYFVKKSTFKIEMPFTKTKKAVQILASCEKNLYND